MVIFWDEEVNENKNDRKNGMEIFFISGNIFFETGNGAVQLASSLCTGKQNRIGINAYTGTDTTFCSFSWVRLQENFKNLSAIVTTFNLSRNIKCRALNSAWILFGTLKGSILLNCY